MDDDLRLLFGTNQDFVRTEDAIQAETRDNRAGVSPLIVPDEPGFGDDRAAVLDVFLQQISRTL